MEADEVADTNLLIEGRGTLTTIFSLVEYPRAALRELHILWPERRDYTKAVEVMAELLRRGTPVPAIDVLIASMCMNRGMRLATHDNHFARVREAFPEFRVRVDGAKR